AGDKTATFHPTDAEDEGFAGVDDPWLVVCDDGPIMRIKGAVADPPAVDGSITVTWTSDHQITGTAKLGVVDPVPEHEHEEIAKKANKAGDTFTGQVTIDRPANEMLVVKKAGSKTLTVWADGSIQQENVNDNVQPQHLVNRQNLTDATDQLATKIELEELQVEVDALATTRDAGRWKVVGNAAVRPGEVNFLTTSMTLADNAMTVNDTDLDGKVHGWADLAVGDFVEVVQETAGIRDVGSYGLFKVKADNGGTGMRMLELTLDQGQGSLTSDSNVFIKVFHANNDLDLAQLDDRYAIKNHYHDARYAQKSHSHDYASTDHTHAGSEHRHDGLGLKGADFDYDWNQYHHTSYYGPHLTRKNQFPHENGDWCIADFNNNYMGNLDRLENACRIGIQPPNGAGEWEAGYLGFITFASGENSSNAPVVIYQIIDRERSSAYFQWYVRLMWKHDSVSKVSDLDGKGVRLKGGAVHLKR
ncbi:MAG: hypothetical protein EBY62_05170, partial [Cellvibrionales bacterium]|nr:hypothetical protein [Cellvibrionales bacterium]